MCLLKQQQITANILETFKFVCFFLSLLCLSFIYSSFKNIYNSYFMQNASVIDCNPLFTDWKHLRPEWKIMSRLDR